MFLRKHRRVKDGKTHFYWSLNETYRTPKGPRQRLISYLGELTTEQADEYQGLVKTLNRRESKQLDFLKPTVAPISIDPTKIQVERVRDFGDAWIGVGMWKILKLDRFFSRVLGQGREDISWEVMIQFLVVSRLCESMSKLAISERYIDQSSLSDILGINPDKINKDRLYRTMDQLLEHKPALGEHLKKRYGELFQLDYELLLYDITSTYFEGQCSSNPQAKRGYSRDKRSDCKQVTLALVVTKEGFPLYYEVFDGNRRDVTTVEEVVEAVESIYGKASRIWAMDRGMVSEYNLKWLRERGTYYIVGTPRSMLKQFEKRLTESDWEEVYEDLEVKKVLAPEYQDEVFVLCRSSMRVEKEKAIIERFTQRIEQGLEKLSKAVSRDKRPLRNRDQIQRKIGALLKTNSRAARFFEIQVTNHDEGKKQRLKITWEKIQQNKDWADLSAGCYLLRSNASQQMQAQDLWKAYIGLTGVEEAFRLTKQDLGIRPVWHQKEHRVQSHIFICFLSLVLQRTLEQILVRKGLGRSTRKVLEEFKGLKSMDVVLTTAAGDPLKFRVVSNPEPALKILLQHLNLKTPKRLSLPENVVTKTNTPLLKNQTLTPLLEA
ncbi:MAG: IS1634 family transposase [Pseudomonadota bacterium]